MKLIADEPGYLQHEQEIEELATILNAVAEGTGVGGGVIIGALTMLLALWLDQAPDNVANEIRDRVVAVLKGKADAGHFDLAQKIAMSINGVEIGLAVSSLFLVIEDALSVASPEAKVRCYEVIQRRIAELAQ